MFRKFGEPKTFVADLDDGNSVIELRMRESVVELEELADTPVKFYRAVAVRLSEVGEFSPETIHMAWIPYSRFHMEKGRLVGCVNLGKGTDLLVRHSNTIESGR